MCDTAIPMVDKPAKELSVLDFGAGPGLAAQLIAPSVKSVMCLDIAEPMVAKCKERAEAAGVRNLEAVVMDFSSAEQLEGRTFDIIYISMVLHHMPDIGHWFTEMRKLLAPGGVIAVYDINATPESTALMKTVASRGEGKHGIHHHGFTEASIGDRFGDAGLSVTSFTPEIEVLEYTAEDAEPSSDGHGHDHGHEAQNTRIRIFAAMGRDV